MKNSGETKLFVGILIVAIILVAVAVLPGYLNQKKLPPPIPVLQPKDITRALLVTPTCHMKGDPKAPATLVEFGDFLCPACKASVPKVENLLKTHKGRMNWVFHLFRAASAHVNDPLIVQAAEAAGNQHKFWEMFNAIFAEQDKLEFMNAPDVTSEMMKLAGKLKLDLIQFNADYNSPQIVAKFEKQQVLGTKVGVNSTPTFYFISKSGKVTMLPNTQVMLDFLKVPANWN